jgi:hypothetical protein
MFHVEKKSIKVYELHKYDLCIYICDLPSGYGIRAIIDRNSSFCQRNDGDIRSKGDFDSIIEIKNGEIEGGLLYWGCGRNCEICTKYHCCRKRYILRGRNRICRVP